MHFVTSLVTPAAWEQWTWTFVLELCKHLHSVNKTPVVGLLVWEATASGKSSIMNLHLLMYIRTCPKCI